MITLRAPQRHDRDAPELEPKRRPELRVVDDVAEPSRRRTPAGVVGTLLVLLLFGCIFGIVVFQVFLVQTQSRLDDLNDKISAQVSTQKQLRLDTADLEAPNRIEKDAKDRLGMIPPNDIGYLQAKADDDAKAAFDPAKEPMPTTTAPPTTAVAPASTAGTSASTPTPKTGSTSSAPSTSSGKTTSSSAKTTATTTPAAATTKSTTPAAATTKSTTSAPSKSTTSTTRVTTKAPATPTTTAKTGTR